MYAGVHIINRTSRVKSVLLRLYPEVVKNPAIAHSLGESIPGTSNRMFRAHLTPLKMYNLDALLSTPIVSPILDRDRL
jgi:hypothetical protein